MSEKDPSSNKENNNSWLKWLAIGAVALVGLDILVD